MGKDNEREVLRIGDKWHEPVTFKVTVVKEGNCRASHKKGQTFSFDWCTPEGMCGESFVGMYPVLHSLRVLGDMRELGSQDRNTRIYNCPSRVIQFEIRATYRCNLCGRDLEIKDGVIQSQKLENPDEDLWIRVCPACAVKNSNAKVVW